MSSIHSVLLNNYNLDLAFTPCIRLAIDHSTTIHTNLKRAKQDKVKQCQHLYPTLLSSCHSKPVHRLQLSDFSLTSAAVHCSSPNRTHSDIYWVKFRLVITRAPQK